MSQVKFDYSETKGLVAFMKEISATTAQKLKSEKSIFLSTNGTIRSIMVAKKLQNDTPLSPNLLVSRVNFTNEEGKQVDTYMLHTEQSTLATVGEVFSI